MRQIWQVSDGTSAQIITGRLFSAVLGKIKNKYDIYSVSKKPDCYN